jgi:hypothetical protein
MPVHDAPPANCPSCGSPLSDHPFDQLVPPPAARLLHAIAWALLPLTTLLYLGLLFWGPLPMGFGTGHGYWAVAFISAPSLLLYAVSRLFPRRRLVICLRCSWNHEYPLAK